MRRLVFSGQMQVGFCGERVSKQQRRPHAAARGEPLPTRDSSPRPAQRAAAPAPRRLRLPRRRARGSCGGHLAPESGMPRSRRCNARWRGAPLGSFGHGVQVLLDHAGQLAQQRAFVRRRFGQRDCRPLASAGGARHRRRLRQLGRRRRGVRRRGVLQRDTRQPAQAAAVAPALRHWAGRRAAQRTWPVDAAREFSGLSTERGAGVAIAPERRAASERRQVGVGAQRTAVLLPANRCPSTGASTALLAARL